MNRKKYHTRTKTVIHYVHSDAQKARARLVGVMFTRILTFFLFIAVLTGCASSHVTLECQSNRETSRLENIIQVSSSYCHEDDTCSVSMFVPKTIDGRDFIKFRLRKGHRLTKNLELDLSPNTYSKENSSRVTTELTGSIQFLESVTINVLYSPKDSCYITSVISLKHNKERNRVDATYVAPIR